jgi:membrane protease YdiL (CAAX protease family)
MATVEPAELPPRPWGYVTTLLWVLLAAIVATVATVVIVQVWYPDRLGGLADFASDAALVLLLTNISTPFQIAVLVLAARFARWRPTDYLGLGLPSRREAVIAFAWMAAFAVGYDGLTYLLGKDIVTPFQVEVYRGARAGGALVAMWIALVIAAPLGEEITFRGFLYRGWAQSPRTVVPAVVVISAAWAILHIQYDWYGILQIFLIGLLLGWIRWRSGSTLLTIALHSLINLYATIQTVAKVEWLG